MLCSKTWEIRKICCFTCSESKTHSWCFMYIIIALHNNSFWLLILFWKWNIHNNIFIAYSKAILIWSFINSCVVLKCDKSQYTKLQSRNYEISRNMQLFTYHFWNVYRHFLVTCELTYKKVICNEILKNGLFCANSLRILDTFTDIQKSSSYLNNWKSWHNPEPRMP